MRVFRVVLSLSLLLLAPASASGDAVSDARAKFRAGAAAYREARYKDAVDLFLQANQLDPHPELVFNVAQAFEKLGDVSSALRAYRDYLRLAPDGDEKAAVTAGVDRLEQRFRERGLRQVSIFSKPAGARVFLDEVEIGGTPVTFETTPGRHVIVLKSVGLPDVQRELSIAGDRSVDVDVTLGGPRAEVNVAPGARPAVSAGASAAPASMPVETATPGGERVSGIGLVKPWTWAAFGAGVVGLGAAAGLEAARAGAESAGQDEPTQVGARERYDAMLAHQTGARVMVGVGAVGIAAGALLLVLDLRSGKVVRASSSSSEAAPRPAFALGCGGTGCGLSVRGGF